MKVMYIEAATTPITRQVIPISSITCTCSDIIIVNTIVHYLGISVDHVSYRGVSSHLIEEGEGSPNSDEHS